MPVLLNIPIEVFVLIFQLLTSQDLLRCAAVCSQWRDLALDVRWKEHPVDLVELLQEFGSIKQSYCTSFHLTLKHSNIQDAIASAEWRRLNQVRRKVTRLRIETGLRMSDIDYVIKLHRAVESPHNAFCPNLRQLDVILALQPQPYPYEFLAGGSLVDIKMHAGFRGPYGAVDRALEKVALRCPQVERIDASQVCSWNLDYGIFPTLRILQHVGCFPAASWMQLSAGCPLLEQVTIRWMKYADGDEEAGTSQQKALVLPALRALTIIDTEQGVLGSYILRITNPPGLTELHVELDGRGFSRAKALFSLIRRRSPSLEKLTVKSNILEWGIFASFTRLRNLELFGYLSSFMEDHVASITENVPNLGRLVIGSFGEDNMGRTMPPFTPDLLETIAKQCHQLAELEIPLNTLSCKLISPTAIFNRLKILALAPLHIEPQDMEPFARYLAQLCPTVERFKSVLIHMDEFGAMDVGFRSPTDEERINSSSMVDLFFNVRRSAGGASENLTLYSL